tara:strand:- start:4335 stop:4802 length:468 start_codon:yes stop_codon:yes gene_type:complete
MNDGRLPKPESLVLDLNQLYGRYVQAIQQVLQIYPQYASDPTASGESELFAEKSAELQQVEADLFLLRNKTEGAIMEAAVRTSAIEDKLASAENSDKKLSKRLEVLDMQLMSADGRLQDTIYLYREAYVSNCLLAAGLLFGGYYTYNSLFGKPSA